MVARLTLLLPPTQADRETSSGAARKMLHGFEGVDLEKRALPHQGQSDTEYH